MVSTLYRCSYDNSTISSFIKLSTKWRFSLFFLLSLFFLSSLFFNICFSSLCQRVVLLNFLDTKVNPNSLLFSERERGGGGSGGTMVLRILSVPGRPTNLDNSRTRAYCACSRCGRGLFGHFFLSSFFLFSFSLFRRRPDID